MRIIDATFKKELSGKTACDLCMEEPENGVLFEKPNSMIVDGQVYVAVRPRPMYVCLECLQMEAENMF